MFITKVIKLRPIKYYITQTVRADNTITTTLYQRSSNPLLKTKDTIINEITENLTSNNILNEMNQHFNKILPNEKICILEEFIQMNKGGATISAHSTNPNKYGYSVIAINEGHTANATLDSKALYSLFNDLQNNFFFFSNKYTNNLITNQKLSKNKDTYLLQQKELDEKREIKHN